jgi:choline-phosphate cytidylyltransferase
MPASKRKRPVQPSAVVATQQPSSRDASDEDTRDDVLQEVVSAKTDQQQRSDEMMPAPKRARSDRAVEERLEYGEGGERGTMRMADPPKAGSVHPKGYKTNPPPMGRPVRIYADGVFDLFHLGHMRQLQQAKIAFPDVYLIVGVTGDKETHRRKGLTVLSGKERAESVRHCKWVDEVVEDCPWIIADAPDFMEKYKIDYVAHDDIPYGADEGDDIYAPIKKAGKFLVTQRTEGVSTTGIITKIVKDYDQYIARQLKRGTTRQELNVSWVKKNELDIKRAFGEIRDNIKTNWMTTGQELTRELRSFWNPANNQTSSPGSRNASPGGADRDGRRSPVTSGGRSLTSFGAGGGDFAAGYSLGLIGGVRGWVSTLRHTNMTVPMLMDLF